MSGYSLELGENSPWHNIPEGQRNGQVTDLGSWGPALTTDRGALLTERILPASITLACGVLAVGFGLSGLWAWMPLIIALGLMWLVAQWRGWTWMASVGLVCFVAVAAVGLWLGLGEALMVFGAVTALTAWDLDYFARHLRGTARVEGVRNLEKRHLRRLLAVDGLSLLLAAVALGVQIRLTIGIAIILGLLAVLGLGQAVHYLRRESI